MGAGGSIPRTEYQIERAKDLDGHDLTDLTTAEIKSELTRIRQLLHKYADTETVGKTDISLTDIDEQVENDKFMNNNSTFDTDHQTKALCRRHILHFRKMLRQPSLLASRKVKEQRRRLSLQGQNLARLALNGIVVADFSSDSEDDDVLEEMPRK